MGIKLTKEVEQRLVVSIQKYLSEEMGQDAGELKAKLFLRFCVEEIGPAIYNSAVADAQNYLQERVADLENVCFAEEGQFWKQKGASHRGKPVPVRR